MSFPEITPTSRRVDLGQWPVKTYNAQNGAEVRLLYGNRRTKLKMDLSYSNITDLEAEQFLAHYKSVNGTFETFDLGANSKVIEGWHGDSSTLTGSDSGNSWRYDGPPVIDSVRPGVSNVSVTLAGVF